jgi:pimeloyl-ACP methyl ester carboxylesterase
VIDIPPNFPYEVVQCAPDDPAHPTPILFIHGAWHGAWCWEKFLPTFAKAGFYSVAFSLRGHGTSWGRSLINITRLADYLDDLRVMVSRFDTPPILVGHSMGGLMIQHLLSERDDIPAAVLLASAPPHGTGGLALRTALYRPRIARHVMQHWDVYPLVAEPTPDGKRFFSPCMSDDLAEDYMRRFTHESFIAVGVDALLLHLPRPHNVHTPLLIFGGSHDILFTPDEVRQTARAYGTTAHIMQGMGHDLMLDPGWEQVATQTIHWLGEQQPSM